MPRTTISARLFFNMNITGTHIAYKIICERKLWLFAHQIMFEQDSNTVAEGKFLHEHSYKRNKKELNFGPIQIDWIDLNAGIVHEVKKSNKVEEAHIWQLKYYLYYLRSNNIGNYTGILNYPLLKKTKEINLSDDDIVYIEKMIHEIDQIVSFERPPEVNRSKKFCKKCSYYEICSI